MTERVPTLIVDDEPIARAGLRRMLAEVSWIDCVGEAASGPAALEAIAALRPQVAFLDIEMPGLSGIDVLRSLAQPPYVVFTTAYAEHAVAAFELGAIDYLLKPFGSERLHASLERVRAALGEPRAALLDRLGEALSRAPMSRLFVRSGRNILAVPVASIAWFEAIGDYVAAHPVSAPQRAAQNAGTQTAAAQPAMRAAAAQRPEMPGAAAPHLLHLSLNRLEERLDPQRFVRIHRTRIVNLDHVATFRRQLTGAVVAELRDGTVLPVSRAKAQELRQRVRVR